MTKKYCFSIVLVLLLWFFSEQQAAAVASCFGHKQKDAVWNPLPPTGAFQDLLAFAKVSEMGPLLNIYVAFCERMG